MRMVLTLLLTCATLFAAGQEHVQDLAKDNLSRERIALLNELRVVARKELGQDVKFVVTWLKVYRGFAFIRANVKSASGGDIDFSKIPEYKEAVDADAFDGDGVMALLQKVAGHWQYITHAIGPTDVAYACWWKEFKAPKQIFDVAEDCAF